MRQLVIYAGEDGYRVSGCPSLSACISQDRIKEETITNIREATDGYIAALEEDHLARPPDRFEAAPVAMSADCRAYRDASA